MYSFVNTRPCARRPLRPGPAGRRPFEVDRQTAHLFKHARLGIADIWEVWQADPLFYPARPPAHWLMVAEVSGRVLVVPLVSPDDGDVRKCHSRRPPGPGAATSVPVDRDGSGAIPGRHAREVRRRADADDRSASGWIRRAVEHELKRDAG